MTSDEPEMQELGLPARIWPEKAFTVQYVGSSADAESGRRLYRARDFFHVKGGSFVFAALLRYASA